MNQANYSFTKLWPEFDRVIQWDITSAEGLSALFVLVLFAFVIIFALISMWSYWRARRHIKFYSSLLRNLTAEQLLEKRRDINEAMKGKQAYGRLWREFDESLVVLDRFLVREVISV